MLLRRHLIPVLFIATLAIVLTACNNAAVTSEAGTDTAAAPQPMQQDTSTAYDDHDDYVIMYVVVADTGLDYYPLQQAMYSLSSKTNLPIDTMNRYYNKQKNEIVLAESDEDEMYRGEYFPRRFPSAGFSLEYYRIYSEASTEKNIALVAGMYEAADPADSALTALRAHAPRSFLVEAKVYLGCMH